MKTMISNEGYVFKNTITGEVLCEEVYMPDTCDEKDFEQITIEEAERIRQEEELPQA